MADAKSLTTILFTISSGAKAEAHYSVAGENLKEYAKKYGMDYTCINYVKQYKEPHYAKTFALQALRDGYQCVVYFDIDGVLDVNAPDIREGIEPSGIHIYNELDLVESFERNDFIRASYADYCRQQGIEWDGKKYYNTGVFVLFPDAACILDIADMKPGTCCHEQHAINLNMLRHHDLVHDLPEQWNWHRLQFKERREGALTGKCYFAHVAGLAARGKDNGIALMKEIKRRMNMRTKKRFIVVPITPDYECVASLTMPFIKAYADKCNATLITLSENSRYNSKFRIFEVADIAETDARYLLIDADVIPRSNSPDIFEAYCEGNWMLDEQAQRESGAFSAHRAEIERRTGTKTDYAHWWNPGVSLLDYAAIKAIFKMPEYDVEANENLWDVGSGKRIVKNMPCVNRRIAESKTTINALPYKWNMFANKTNDLDSAYFIHCAGHEYNNDRLKEKIALIKSVIQRFESGDTLIAHFVVGDNQMGWTLGEFVNKMKSVAPKDVVVTSGQHIIKSVNAVNVFTPYRAWKDDNGSAKSVVFFTHPGDIDKWNAATKCDAAIVMNEQYRQMLIDNGMDANKVHRINYGIDEQYRDCRLRIFCPGKMVASDEYIERKGWDDWQRLMKCEWLVCKRSEGLLTKEQMLDEYLKSDVIVSTATLEGGPMACIEALALDKPYIGRAGVGLHDEYKDYIWRYKDYDGLACILFEAYKVKEKRSRQVIANSWPLCAEHVWKVIGDVIGRELVCGEHSNAIEAIEEMLEVKQEAKQPRRRYTLHR